MSRIDEVLAKDEVVAEETLPEKVLENKGNWLDALLEKARAHYDSIQPVDVEIMLGEAMATLRIPFMRPGEFSDLTDYHPPRPGVAADMPLWFSLSDVTRVYPGIVLVTDDGEDNLFRLRDKEAAYVWPELYDALAPEDAKNARMAVWALHVWEPEQRHKAALAKKKEADHG